MPVVSTALTIAISSKAISKIVEEIYAASKPSFGDQLKRMRNRAAVVRIAKSISAIQNVKTLLQIDKEVPLESIYYPSRILVKGKAFEVKNLSTFPEKHNVILEGTVGQGKSILLRYLALQEVREMQRIPIFFELRRIENFDGLHAAIRTQLTALGFELSHELFEFYCRSGKLVLFLDGFDEIPASKVTSTLSDIETFCTRFPETQIVVTSRQAGGLESSVHFRVFPLAPLQENDYQPFFEKVFEDAQQIELLIKAVKKSLVGIKGLLTTPLNLTLLVLVYKSEHFIPPSLAGFYSVLFQAIVGRHDRAKTGFTRPRKSKLSDREMEELFRAFCFISRQKGYSGLDEDRFHECAKIACEYAQVDCGSAAFKEDIIKNTCLIVADGWEFGFVHSSIQEFFAASFIKNAQTEMAEKFYSRLRTGRLWASWEQELIFLEEIDRYRYLKNFLMPDLEDFLRPFSSRNERSGVADLWNDTVALLKGSLFFYVKQGHSYSCQNVYLGISESYGEREARWFLFRALVASDRFGFYRPLEKNIEALLNKSKANELGRVPIDVCQLALEIGEQQLLISTFQSMLSNLRNRVENGRNFMKSEERKINLLDIG